VSSETGLSYPMTMISEVWRVPRSTIYAARGRARRTLPPEPRKRGPKTAMSDEGLVVEIREVLRPSEFLGEGHRKPRARLRSKGIRAGKNRVLRLTRENGLLAHVRRGKHARGDRSHSGRMTTDAPDEFFGARTRLGSTRRKTAGAGSPSRQITVSRRWSGGMWRRKETAGPPWSPSGSGCAPTWRRMRLGSPWALGSGTTGDRSTQPTTSRPS